MNARRAVARTCNPINQHMAILWKFAWGLRQILNVMAPRLIG